MVACSRWMASLIGGALACSSSAFAADVKPRVLDVTAGAQSVRMSVLDGGQRVHIDWTDEAGVPAGVHIDATSGAVRRHFEPTTTRQFLALTDGGPGRRRETQSAIEVMLETVTGDQNWSGPTRLLETASIRTLADLLPQETALVATRIASGLIIVTGGQNIRPGSARTSYTLRLWEAEQPEPRWTFDVPSSRVGGEFASAAVTLSADGKWVMAVRDRVLHLIDAATGVSRIIERSAGDVDGAIGVGFSQDGKQLYVADGGADVRLMRLPDLADIRRITTPQAFPVRHVTEHAGGKILELTGRRQTMFLDPASGRFVRRDRGSSTNSYILAWLGNGRLLLAARARREPVKFRLYTHTAGSFDAKDDRTWTGGNMAAVAWSPNGRCLLMSGGGKTAVLATDTLRELAMLVVVGDGLETAVFARGGAAVVAVEGERRVLMFDMPEACRSKA